MEDVQNHRTYGGLEYDDAAEFIVDYLQLNATSIRGLQKQGAGTRRIEIAVNDDSFYSDAVQGGIGEWVRLSSGRKVFVSLPDDEVTDVYIKGIPMSWTLEKVKHIFSYYGEIRKVENLRLQSADVNETYREFIGCPNGNLKLIMRFRPGRDIPSSLNIDKKFLEMT